MKIIAKIKKSVPLSVKRALIQQANRVELYLITLFSANGFLSSLYYTLFSRQFYREHLAVLRGRLAYQQSLVKPAASSALLRRNIHRLEKGLIMRPRRAVFAEDYISETVVAFAKAQANSGFCQQEFNWANAVLTQYFAVVTDTAIIAKARAHFAAVSKADTPAPAGSVSAPAGLASAPDAALGAATSTETVINNAEPVPYLHQCLPEPAISYPQLLSLFTRRRSVRWYLPKPVPAALIEQAVAAASLAPSACNRQPYQFIVLNDANKAAAAAKCAMGTVGFAENIPCLLVVTGDLAAYPAERDRHIIYIDAALASMQLMLALETLGLSSCPINWPDIEAREQALSNMLNLPYQQRVIMLLAVGYADPEGGIAYSQKKPNELLIRDDSHHAN